MEWHDLGREEPLQEGGGGTVIVVAAVVVFVVVVRVSIAGAEAEPSLPRSTAGDPPAEAAKAAVSP